MRDVAVAASVHASSVSRALSNNPQVSEAERTRIRAIADRLGYRPNPFVAAFTAQVRGYRCSPDHATIAVLDCWPAGASRGFLARYLAGIRARAEELGHSLDHHALHGSLPALDRILRARGTPGLLILPVPAGIDLSALPLDHRAAATIDYSLKAPALHRAAPHYFQHMQTALRELAARGCQQIGYCTYLHAEERLDAQWLGAYTAWQALQPASARVPVHFNPYDEEITRAAPRVRDAAWRRDRDAFLRWLGRAHPDAIISNDFFFLNWLRESGARVPRDIAFVSLNTEPDHPGVAGIDQQHEAIGAAAVDLILGQFHRNDYGAPGLQKTVHVNGRWTNGSTVRTAGARTRG